MNSADFSEGPAVAAAAHSVATTGLITSEEAAAARLTNSCRRSHSGSLSCHCGRCKEANKWGTLCRLLLRQLLPVVLLVIYQSTRRLNGGSGCSCHCWLQQKPRVLSCCWGPPTVQLSSAFPSCCRCCCCNMGGPLTIASCIGNNKSSWPWKHGLP